GDHVPVLLNGRRRSIATRLPVGGHAATDELNLAGRAVDQRVEDIHGDLAVGHRLEQALHQSAVEVAHQVGADFGDVAERAVGEGDGGAVALDVEHRIEAEPVEQVDDG